MRMLLSLFLTVLLLKASAAERPNFVIFLSDDHSVEACGAYKGDFAPLNPSPEIDRLAKDGATAEFMFSTNAICSPSRAALLTGQYSHVNGVYSLTDALKCDAPSMARTLQAKGYKTAIFGKWHLRDEPCGFDHYAVLPEPSTYVNPVFWTSEFGWNYDMPAEGYTTELITEMALKWMDKVVSEGNPYFIIISHKAIHGPWDALPQHEKLYEKEDFEVPASMDYLIEDISSPENALGASLSDRQLTSNMKQRLEVDKVPLPKLPADPYARNKVLYNILVKRYLRCLRGLDESLGQVRAFLDQRALADETLLLYTSDQGYLLGEHDMFGKRWMYEESIRVPFIAYMPGTIPPGTRFDEMCLNIDIAPTLIEMAGYKPDEGIQGQSMRLMLEGKTPANWRRSIYYRYWNGQCPQRVPAQAGVRTERYKLVFYYDFAPDRANYIGPYWGLYDLETDPDELYNVFTNPKYAEIKLDMRKRLGAEMQRFSDGPNDPYELKQLIRNSWY